MPRSDDDLAALEAAQIELARQRPGAIGDLLAARAMRAGLGRDSRIAMAEAPLAELEQSPTAEE